MTLHALRLTVGDEAFFEILRTYAAEFADGTALTTDFMEIAAAVSGMDLEELFEEWLFERAVPEFPEPAPRG
jgi:aminopeptidase N